MGNLVRSGLFESTDGWKLLVRQPAQGSFTLDTSQKYAGSQSLRVDVARAAPDEPWDVQALQAGISLHAGQAYQLSFAARSAVGQAPLSVEVQQSSAPYHAYLQHSVRLTTTWRVYDVTFVAQQDDPNALLDFNFAASTGRMWIDAVALVPVARGSSPPSTLLPSPTAPAMPTEPATITTPPGLRMVFDDEFDGGAVDQTKWNVLGAPGSTYTNSSLNDGLQQWSADAVTESGGALHITSTRRGASYQSGAMTTENRFSFQYGRVDIRAKLPGTDSLWSAFWLLPSHSSSAGAATHEVDIMEMLGQDPTTVYMVNHFGSDRRYCQFTGPDVSAGFHVYTFIWTPTMLEWDIDGVARCTVTAGIPQDPMYLIVNTYIGGSLPTPPDSNTSLPQTTVLDYVRVYQPA
ncbi:MAG: hypothetical protein PVSMB4_13280 [Ktedonobacterales bacterium]